MSLRVEEEESGPETEGKQWKRKTVGEEEERMVKEEGWKGRVIEKGKSVEKRKCKSGRDWKR